MKDKDQISAIGGPSSVTAHQSQADINWGKKEIGVALEKARYL
jgi:hypothetical protein